jgi:hypothetical protein
VIKRLSPSAVKWFLRITTLWDLRDEDARQLLGGISNGAFYELKNTNPMFGGESPLAYMIKGRMPAMLRVRQLPDARRGGP